MTLRQWLTNYIHDAFHGVKLDDGVDIHTARYQDSHGCDEKEHRLSLGCQKSNWEQIDPQILRDRAWVMTFLDAKGFRFYLPVIMIDIIKHQNESDLAETLFYRFSITPDGQFDGIPFYNTFSHFQRAAIVRFLKYLRYNAGWKEDSKAQKLLDRIKTRTWLDAEPSDQLEVAELNQFYINITYGDSVIADVRCQQAVETEFAGSSN